MSFNLRVSLNEWGARLVMAMGLISAIGVPLAFLIIILVLMLGCSGCATKSVCMDGYGVNINKHAGFSLFTGSLRSIAIGMDYLEITETVTTSIFNSNARDYKRVSVWASSNTNRPPDCLSEIFAPNVNTEVLYATVTNGNSVLNVIRAVETN